MIRVNVEPDLLRWARERANRTVEELGKKFPKLELWERGEARPTFKQLEAFAKAMYVPIGYLFLSKPPEEQLPIPDLRTIANQKAKEPSLDLLDTIYLCQQRQKWYHSFIRTVGEPEHAFVRSAKLTDDVKMVAEKMRHALCFDVKERAQLQTWTEALRRFIDQADALGVLVMVNGVVGTNNRRKLNPEEFRGFALCDDLTPLVFINGADTKAAQMFTLAHELAHLWLGESSLSDVKFDAASSYPVETWCNRVAAELLLPLDQLRAKLQPSTDIHKELGRLAQLFKVSTLVVLRRINDIGAFTPKEFQKAYKGELELLRRMPKSKGGNFYLTLAARVGKRFARALVISTFEGQTSFTEAFRLLGVKSAKTLRRFGTELEIGV